MTTKTKSVLIILGTLLVGVIIGGLATSAIFSQRVGAIQALRMQGGLVHYLENVIEPVDESQREQIQALLESTGERQMEMRRNMFDENRAIFSEMRNELDEILTEEQKSRLREWVQRENREGPRFRPPEMRRPREGRRPGMRQRVPRDSSGG